MAKRAPALTVQDLRAKPQTTPIEKTDGAVPGLRLRIMPSGTLSWSLSIRDGSGVRRRFDVGENLGLSAARTKAAALRVAVKEQGADPTRERQEARQRAQEARDGQGTLDALLLAYFEGNGAGAGLRTKDEQIKRIRSVFAKRLAAPSQTLSESDLQAIADAHPSKSSAAAAVRYLSPVLKWAGKRALVPKGMVLEPPTDLTPVKRRVLKEDELRALLPHLTGPHGEACLFMLLTATRLEEVTGAVWSEFDLEAGLWTIPGRRRKDTRGAGKRRVAPAADHIIPLTPQALAILYARKEEREAYEAEIGEKLPHDFVFSGKRWAGALGNWHRELQPIHEASGVLDWSAHSMRRTCATLAGNLGVPPHVTAVMLGRKNLMVEQAGGNVISSDLETTYNRSRYGNEHRAALILVSDFISKIVT